MKLIVHKEDDALYLSLDDSEVIVIELLYISKRSPNSLQKILLETSA
jgi:hypothetical protein